MICDTRMRPWPHRPAPIAQHIRKYPFDSLVGCTHLLFTMSNDVPSYLPKLKCEDNDTFVLEVPAHRLRLCNYRRDLVLILMSVSLPLILYLASPILLWLSSAGLLPLSENWAAKLERLVFVEVPQLTDTLFKVYLALCVGYVYKRLSRDEAN